MSLSLQTQQRLSDLFVALYEGERQAEIMRQVLVEQCDFSPMAIFNLISQGREVISVNVDYTQEELIQVVSDYANHQDELTYNNFLNIILPSLAASLRNIKTGKQRSNPKFSHHIQCALSKVLQQEIQLTRQVERIKDDLIPRLDFSEEAAFALLESFSTKGGIDHIALRRFFRTLSIRVTEDDLLYLLRRVDRDKDGKINNSDFTQIIYSLKHKKTHQPQQRLQSQHSYRQSTLHLRNSLSHNKTHTSTQRNLGQKISILDQGETIKRQRQSSDILFKKINLLNNPSEKKKPINLNHSQRSDRSDKPSHSSNIKRGASPFDRLNISSRKNFTPIKDETKLTKNRSHSTINKSNQNGYLRQTEIENPNVERQQSIQSEYERDTESITPEQLIPFYRHHGVDQRVINEDTNQLVGLLINYIDQFQMVDQSRCQIVCFPDFNIEQLWTKFSISEQIGNRTISVKQFENFSSQVLGSTFNQEQIQCFFQLVDLNRDGLLNYEEFISIFEPTSEYYASIMFGQNDPLNHMEVSSETLQAIKILIDQMIDLQWIYNANKLIFFQKKRYSLLSLFEHLIVSRDGFLSVDDFKSLFEQFGYEATNSELEQVIRKFTKDKFVKIVTMRQFLNELTPNH